MAGTGQNHRKLKHSYFHYNTPLLVHKTSPICTTKHQDQSLVNSPTSPWYYQSSTTSGDKNDAIGSSDRIKMPTEIGTIIEPPLSSTINPDPLTTDAQVQENNGHFFVKKTFHKPTYCHHCVEMLWGFIGQGYYCEGKHLRIFFSFTIQSFLV